ncbi:MAG TPA: glycosyltransferase [Terriglobales bacterium]|nr:glycosyltransferase [Terriglobales bacterium]
MASHCELDLWISENTDLLPAQIRTVHYEPEQHLHEKLQRYDLVVYNMGDYLPYHDSLHTVLQQHSGLIILHDRVLHHFYASLYLSKMKDPEKYISEMSLFYGVEGQEFAKSLDPSAPALGTNEVTRFPLYERAIANASGIVVHSPGHAELIRQRWIGPVKALFLPCYDRNIELASSLPGNQSKNKLLLLTVGVVNRNKHSEIVIDALASHPRLAQSVEYVIIGSYNEGDEYVRGLKNKISQCGLQETVKLMGYQPDAVLHEYLARADLFITLRLPAMEGASASLMQQLPFGKPIMAYDTGCYSEFPDDVIVKIPAGDTDAFIRKLTELVSNESLRSQIGGRAAKLAAQYSVQNYVEQMLDFFPEIQRQAPLLQLSDRVSQTLSWMGTEADMSVLHRCAELIADMFSLS